MRIEYDIKPIQDRLDDMLKKIEDVKASHMPQEFLNWQGEDLNRRVPRIDQQTAITVMTYIRERAASTRLVQVAGRKRRVRMRIRPILRPILFQELCYRMSRMLGSKLTWR
jgi:hypothetical protein